MRAVAHTAIELLLVKFKVNRITSGGFRNPFYASDVSLVQPDRIQCRLGSRSF